MNYIQDLLDVLKTSLKETLQTIKKAPALAGIIFIGIILYRLISSVSITVLGNIPYISGLINYIYIAYFIAFLANVLDNIISHNRINQRTFFTHPQYYFFKVIQIGFLLYILQLASNLILFRLPTLLISIFTMILVIIFSPLLESIYSEDLNGYETFLHSVYFVKDNLIQWIPINILILVALNFLQDYVRVMNGFSYVVSTLLLSLLLAIILIFKGKLYRILAHSNIRKRNFSRQFN